MFGFGVGELLVILVIALVFFGPGKLPEVGEALGKGIVSFRKALRDLGEPEPSRSQRVTENTEATHSDAVATPAKDPQKNDLPPS